jgi:hypothetical protein
MGRYASQSDVEAQFGTANIAAWSQLDVTMEPPTTDTARVTAAIAYAEDSINDRFRDGRYIIPLSPVSSTPKVLIRWVAILSGLWLYQSRAWDRGADSASRMSDLELQVKDEIQAYASGARGLDCQRVRGDAPTAPVVIR